MVHKKRTNALAGKIFVGVCCISILMLNLSGCTPLRKKFTRQKKKDAQKEKFIPVLDPIDYPAKVYTSEQRYKYHYSLWMVWNKEFLQTIIIKAKRSEKQKKYLVTQMITQAEEMRKWVIKEKQVELSFVVEDLYKIQKELSKPIAMRSDLRIKRNIERVAKKIRNEFNPRFMEPFLAL